MKKTMLIAISSLLINNGFAEDTPNKAPDATKAINCNFHIDKKEENIPDTTISQWASQATQQAFDYDAMNVDKKMEELKSCFTTSGWKGFSEALKKSGNVKAIKEQKLAVSSQVSGDVKVEPSKKNQWKVKVPLQVVYQNNEDKLTQVLAVDLLVGRKSSGDLGIMQMIATPK